MKLLKAEPVLIIQGIALVLALVASFGLSLSAEQTMAVMALAQYVAAFISRSQVTPVKPAGDG